ncbi:ribosomal L32p family protein [Pseudomassariella vexata]|uniref:Large ribosomal subunit protein bL32m n=1 Tax=Pseudomassariella vexata TaxID=1141098 RepID=A0A1Y2DCY4_9PEZI|nr:ribosomal L32p family protein [Pseudomassariella vexata]ORY56976.1 ribosomal L32p family protein [Pseudomassariella vexata]
MAAIQQLRMASAVSSLFPRLASTTYASPFRTSVWFGQQSLPSIPQLAVAIPAALQTIPGFLGEIWDGILKAVPKKKTSHMKKRHRQMAGKALKDVTALNKCPACGQTKKMHTLCPHCMGKIQGMFPNTSKQYGD